jgi:hypothetical protein
MKMLFASPQSQDIEFLKTELDKAGIQCEVRNFTSQPSHRRR